MKPGTYPSDYPGTHIKYAYLSGLHKEQFVHAALRAQDEGYDAFLIATIPDTGYEECRALVDIPVVAFGQTSVLHGGSTLGSTVGIVNFIGALEPQLRRNLRNYGLDAAGRPDPAGGCRVHRRHARLRRTRADCSRRSAPRPARRSAPVRR